MKRLKLDRSMKFRIAKLILLIAGLAVLLYPVVSMKWNAFRDVQLTTQYDDKVKGMDRSEIREMMEKARAYNKTLYIPTVPDAFSVREGVHDPLYESLLNVNGDGIMGYVEIPEIDIKLPIYHYSTEESLQKGAGHLFGSSLPIGGTGVHSVITAHRGLPQAKMFTDLNLLKKQDQFYVHVLDKTLAYQVDQILTVEPDQTESLAIDHQKDYVTLVTCTPYGVNTQRLLVRGHRVPYSEKAHKAAQRKPGRQDPDRLVGQIISGLAGLAIAFVIIQIVMRVRKKS